MKRLMIFSSLCIAGILVLSACLPGLPAPENPTPAPTFDPNQMATVVEKTVSIRQTIAVLESQIALGTSQVTALPTSPTNTPRPPTATPTQTPIPTFTLIVPTVVPVTPTSSVPCNAATFVEDVTFPDNTVVSPEQAFTKIWRLKNSGSCPWTTSYSLVFASGAQMGGPAERNLLAGVKPDETVDIAVNLTAPKDAGDYRGYWQLRSADGILFSTGGKNEPFWVKVRVGSATMASTSFVDNFCAAVWKNNAGTSLACPGSKTEFKTGSVYRYDNPILAGDVHENEPALVMIPSDGSDGKITGRFPAIKVLSGDHFISLLGCINASTKCSVTFRLSYTIDGTTVTELGAWDRAYDQNWAKVDINLSSLADKSVIFILSVSNRDGSAVDDSAFWLKPYIKR
jgi:hypothetical protein